MTEHPEHDEELMDRVASGEYQAMEPLVRRYANPLMTFIRRTIHDARCSDDLFQEVFLAVWKFRGHYKYPQPFRLWLFKIAMNTCRAHFRSSRPTFALGDGVGEWLAGSEPLPEQAAVATETASLVTEAVKRLPAKQRTILVLRIWNGLSYPEIAKVVGRREGSVRSNMHHALTAMREYLEPRLRN